MKKGIIIIGLVGVLLLLFFLFKPNAPKRNVTYYDGTAEELVEELIADTAVVVIFDGDGNMILSRRDSANKKVEE